MLRKWRVLAVITAAASALYVAGIGVMALAPPPWNVLSVLPLALLAAAVVRHNMRPLRGWTGRPAALD